MITLGISCRHGVNIRRLSKKNNAVQRKKVKRDELQLMLDENVEIKNENKVIKKTVLEQQKFLEIMSRDRTKNNIFVSGVPNQTTKGEGSVEANHENILKSVLDIVDPAAYRILKNFDPKDEAATHKFTNLFHDLKVKSRKFKGCKNFKRVGRRSSTEKSIS